MSSSKGNNIAVDEPADEIEKKIMAAYCPAKITENNPITEIFKYHIFPRVDSVTVRRPAKFGGDVTFESYRALEDSFVSGSLHPMDLKKACAEYMIEILAPVRERVKSLRAQTSM
jgi:tyrosyl-tRNA synthetase